MCYSGLGLGLNRKKNLLKRVELGGWNWVGGKFGDKFSSMDENDWKLEKRETYNLQVERCALAEGCVFDEGLADVNYSILIVS